MSPVYNEASTYSKAQRQAMHELLRRVFSQPDVRSSQDTLKQGLRQLSKQWGEPVTQDAMIAVFREDAGNQGLPTATAASLSRIRMKPMRSHSGIQSVAVLTKPFPCPGQCIFCPNDVRMPKSYIASEPGAQRAERNSFDPYLQTYNRLRALHNMGHEPSKIELIVLGGTWSDYPEAYQIWFIKECFRALNDFGDGQDDRQLIEADIAQTVQTAHRLQNRVINEDAIRIDGHNLQTTYNQVVAQHYLAPEQLLEKQAVPRREQATWDQLEAEHTRNESADVRCVGLTLETRPDNISLQEVHRIRRLGATKTQIGFQSLNDDVLRKNKRGHDTAATRRAVALLRQAGFKIHAHWMPNLYGSTVTNDLNEYRELFHNDAYKPDELKIYPCALIPSAELMQYAQRGEWQSYSEEELNQILRYALLNTPEWARLTRVVRDIPSQETVDTNIKTNQRQIVEQQLQKKGHQLNDIRGREIRRAQPQPPIALRETWYTTSTSRECFLQFVDANNRILGFLRLSLPTAPSPIAELSSNAIIRELHVYGIAQKVGQKGEKSPQHQGYGSQLLERAESIAQNEGFDTLSVISAIGTRAYYRRRGFADGELYQHKKVTPLGL